MGEVFANESEGGWDKVRIPGIRHRVREPRTILPERGEPSVPVQFFFLKLIMNPRASTLSLHSWRRLHLLGVLQF